MKPRILRLFAAIAGAIGLLLALVVARAATVSSVQVDAPPTRFASPSDAADRLAQAVRFRTISHADPARMDLTEFARFNEFLVTAFPAAHAAMSRELIEPCSLLYTWAGQDPKARPVLLLGHTDVVPVEPEQLPQWTHPPFGGVVAADYIWGRGTLDDKVGVLGLLEAVEQLAAAGHRPTRDLVFAFGCDEEVGGEHGAKRIAARLSADNRSFEFLLDEGLAVVRGYVPGTAAPVALIGIAEKGFGTWTLHVESEGGHSSMPPPNSAIGILARAITRVEENQRPSALNPASWQMFETLAPHVDFGLRVVFANLWLLEPVLLAVLESQPQTAAAVRTTTAVTMMNAGIQDNVLPRRAEAKVNFRLAIGEELEDVHRHLVDVIDDERVHVTMPPPRGFANPASRVSDTQTEAFATVRDAIRATFGNEVLVAPSSTTAGTDARHYEAVSDQQYRFAPLLLDKAQSDTARIHGVDERISIANYARVVTFYTDFLNRL